MTTLVSQHKKLLRLLSDLTTMAYDNRYSLEALGLRVRNSLDVIEAYLALYSEGKR